MVLLLPITTWPNENCGRWLVIARKLSFGSQSDAGARTRETLMTVLNTLKKKTPEVTAAFKSALDKLAEQPDSDPSKLLSEWIAPNYPSAAHN